MQRMRWEQLTARLCQVRKDSGIRVVELAETLGVVRATVYNWEGGRSSPNIDQLHQWCTALGVGIHFTLLGDEVAAFDEDDHLLMEAFLNVADDGAVDAVRRLLESYLNGSTTSSGSASR